MSWATRGIAETNGHQVQKLYDLACSVHERRSAVLEVLSLRREQHQRMASPSTYSRLRSASEAADRWDIERTAARMGLRERDPAGLIDALLGEGDIDEVWSATEEASDWQPGLTQRLRLAEARETQHPEQALPSYMLVVDELLLETSRQAYARAIAVLEKARRAAETAGQSEWFVTRLTDLRERHRRRPTFITMLDKNSLN